MEALQFVPSYPCYVIEIEGAVATVDIESQECIAVFTDEDLVQRYLEETRLTGKPLAINDQAEFCQYLRSMHSDRFTHVAFDAVGGKATYWISISDVLQQLR